MTTAPAAAMATHIGKVREVNQDRALCNPPLFAVADGMGGHVGGDVASTIAIETFQASKEDLSKAIQAANEAVFEASESNERLYGMGTTLTAIKANESSLELGHVGDSRAYRIRGNVIEQISNDHTQVGRMLRDGSISREEAEVHPKRHYLDRALGIEPTVKVDLERFKPHPGDVYLICSDGLSTMVRDDEIAQIVLTSGGPQQTADNLCRAAVDAGGKDNVTVVVLQYPGDSEDVPPPPAKKPRKFPRRTFLALLLALIALLSARGWINSQVFVGQADSEVAIRRGIPGEVAGFTLSKVDARTGIQVSDLPEIYRRRLEDGIKADDEKEAKQVVENLRRIAAQET